MHVIHWVPAMQPKVCENMTIRAVVLWHRVFSVVRLLHDDRIGDGGVRSSRVVQSPVARWRWRSTTMFRLARCRQHDAGISSPEWQHAYVDAVGRPACSYQQRCATLCYRGICCHRVSVCNVGAPLRPTQPVEIFGNFSSPYDSPGTLFFWCQNSLVGTPIPPEICVKSDPTPFKQRNFDQYWLIVSQPL